MDSELDQPKDEGAGESLQQALGTAPEEMPSEAAAAPVSELRAGSLVVQGVLRGTSDYVVRPTPLTPDAVRRLRARSFRAAVLGELMARWVAERLGLVVLIKGGGRFLLAGAAPAGWEEHLHSLQREFDIWLFQHLQPAGQLQCYLAGAICPDDRVPLRELDERLRQARLQPLEGAVRVGLRWNGRAFVLPAGPHIGLCAGCAAVTPVRLFGDESLCDNCATDTELAERLPGMERAWVCPEADSDLPGPGLGLRWSAPADHTSAPQLDAAFWALFRRPVAAVEPPAEGAVSEQPRALALEEFLQGQATGRRLLGYVRVDADGAGRAFRELAGDPARTAGLHDQLHRFFSGQVAQLMATEFPQAVAAPAGGDHLLLIAPWQTAFDLAVRVQQQFSSALGGSLTLSAGLVVAAPHIRMSSAAEQADEALWAAKAAGGNRLATFGETMEWSRAASLLATGRTLAGWLERRAISPAWISRLAELHAVSGASGGQSRWRPALHAMLGDPRIRHGSVRGWTARLLRAVDSGDDSDWRAMPFLARYALLARRPEHREAVDEDTGAA